MTYAYSAFPWPEGVNWAKYCKKVIDVVAEGGGFILDAELPLITAKPENVRAMVEFTREYGVY